MHAIGATDAVSDEQRLEIFLQAVRDYRMQNPKDPVRVGALAALEVDRLRAALDVQRRIRKSLGLILVDNAELIEEQHKEIERLNEFIRRPLWRHALERFIALFD